MNETQNNNMSNSKAQIARGKKLGQRGELIARSFLMRKGFEFKDQNYYAPGGEIDLIMYDPKEKMHVLVEVKVRTSEEFGDIATSVTKSKMRKMMYAFQHYTFKVLKQPETPEFRMDALFLRIDGGKVFCEHMDHIGFE